MVIVHPAQKGPKEILSYAVRHINADTEFEQRIGYLLLDIGVELTLKTYLELPDQISGAQLDFGKRNQAINSGRFFDVMTAVEVAAKNRLSGLDIQQLNYYHNRRNALYHAGQGITIQPNVIQEYTQLACELLYRLLDVDIRSEIVSPEQKQSQINEDYQRSQQITQCQEDIRKLIDTLEDNLRSVVETICPEFILPSFVRSLMKWKQEIDEDLIETLYSAYMRKTINGSTDELALEKAIKEEKNFYKEMPVVLLNFINEYDISTTEIYNHTIRSDINQFYFWLLYRTRNFDLDEVRHYNLASVMLLAGYADKFFGDNFSETEISVKLIEEYEEIKVQLNHVNAVVERLMNTAEN